MNPLIKFGILTLEAMFVIGGLGSAVVLVWAGLEDLRTIFEPEEEGEEP